MSRRMSRLIASAFAAGGVAFGSTVAAALSDGGQMSKSTYWIILAAIIGAMAKDVQASLSEPPRKGQP